MKNIDKKKHKNLILFLKTIFKNNIIILIVIFFSMILTALLNSLLPVILQYIIDSIINNKNIKLLVTLSIIYLIISIFISLLNIWKETKISCFQKKIGVKFKLKMLKKLSTFSGKYYSNLKTGEMINLFENDCDIIANNGITIWFELTSNIVMSILSLYFLFRIQKKILLFVLILQMIIIWTQLVFTRKIANGTKIIREEYGHIYDFVQQYISNIIQVIICKTKKYFFTRYINNMKILINKEIILDFIYVLNSETAQLLSNIITIFIYAYGGYQVIKKNISIGELIAFQQYTWMFISPCVKILKSNTNIQKICISLDRIYNFLNMSEEIVQKNNGLIINDIIQCVEFKKVSFGYENKKILNEISFSLNNGKVYAFVGATGCGKSTLVNLLYRLWDTEEGQILINNKNIKDYNLCSLRKNISIVSQNLFILDDTIEANLTLNNSKITRKHYEMVSKQLGIEQFIMSLPNSYQTVVGENGVKLSGGQKQRIVIARTLLQSKNILIFDEATSALDNITQENIMKNVCKFYKNKIIIIIAHRLSTIKNADIIFVMNTGKICEMGNHKQLIEKKGYYYQLVKELEN